MKKDYIKLLTVAIIWGGVTPATKIGVLFISPFTLNFLRYSIAFLLLLLIATIRKERLRISRKDLPLILVLGLLGGIISGSLWPFGLLYTTASDAGIIIGAQPAVIVILSAILAKESVSVRTYISAILCFIGIWFIVMQGKFVVEFTKARAFGDLLIIANSFSWALFTVINKFALKKMEAWIVTFYVMLLASLFYFPISIYERCFVLVAKLPLIFWLVLFYIAVLGMFVSYQWWISSVGNVGPAKVGIFYSLVPVFSLIFSVIFVGEMITIFHIVGMVLIIIGVMMVSKG